MGQVDDSGRGRHAESPAPPPPDAPGPRLNVAPVAGPPGPNAAAHAGAASTAVPGRHRAHGSLGLARGFVRRPAARLALAAVVLSAVVLAVVVAVTRSSPDDDGGTSPGTTSGRDLTSWASAQLPVGATLAADPALAAALEQSGMGSGMLGTASSTSSGTDGPALRVVQGGDPAGGTVVARFADGDGGEFTVVDPAAVPPDAAALEQRRSLGAAVLANPATMAPAPAAQLLRDGDVDPRLLTLLAGLAARFQVQLADLSVVPGEEGLTPVRSAVLAAAGGRPLTEGTEPLSEVQTWLSAQRGPYAPDDVRLVDGGLTVGFRYVTDPDGAVTRAGG